MNSDTQKRADELLSQTTGGRFPVPIIEIATNLGIQVLSQSDYPNDGNGHIEIDKNGKAKIIVNERQSAVRKRFTIAHEIAHFIFDMDYLKKHGSIDRDGNAADPTYRARERHANNFAALLLMPENAFVEQWFALSTVEKVADYFSVSKESAKFRAINLGLMKAE